MSSARPAQARNRAINYQQIPTSDAVPLAEIGDGARKRPAKPFRSTTFALHKRGWVTVSCGLNVVMLCVIIYLAAQTHDQQLLHGLSKSPASSIERYEQAVFSSGFGIEQSPFQGPPSVMNNQLWEDLYDFGITRITAEEAKIMVNKTLPIPDDEGGYVIQLSVFHQLHCLNLVRHGLYGEADMSNEDELLGIEHLDHCIDTVRQGIMCHSDITPLTFARQRPGEPMKAVAEVSHTCRDFREVQKWALSKRVREDFDKFKVVTDDPLGWGDYTYSP